MENNANALAHPSHDIPMDVRKERNYAFTAFVLYSVVDLMFRALKALGYNPSISIFFFIMGCLLISGYVYLYRLASTLSADFFTVWQIMLELFTPLSVLVVFVLGSDYIEDYLSIYYLSILICLVAILNWSLLLFNCKFPWHQRIWILSLPLIRLFNLSHYWNYTGMLDGRETLVHVDFYENPITLTIMAVLILARPVGFWMLTHSKAYQGNKDERSMPSFSPLNPYLIVFAILSAISFMVF